MKDVTYTRAATKAWRRAPRNVADRLPAAVVDRLVEGERPVRVFREHRGLSVSALARNSGVNRAQLHDIEAGRKTGSVETMRKLADALGVAIDDLV
ncbi:MAG: hypothetical protein AcusKO_37980 [Acuticoccus sp.]